MELSMEQHGEDAQGVPAQRKQIGLYVSEIPIPAQSYSLSLQSRITAWMDDIPPNGKNVVSEAATAIQRGNLSALPFGKEAVSMASLGPTEIASHPHIPASDVTDSKATRSSTSELVKQEDYQEINLANNNISMLSRASPMPRNSQALWDGMAKPITSVLLDGPDIGRKINSFWDIQVQGILEADFSVLFYDMVLPRDYLMADHGLRASSQTTFLHHLVPGAESTNEKRRVSVPRTDRSYGYMVENGKFTEAQRLAGAMIKPPMGLINNWNMAFPFLLLELKTLCTGRASNMKVALNQLLAACRTCVDMVEGLNSILRQYPEAKVLDQMCFGAAINPRYAVFYAMWKTTDGKYQMKEMGAYLLTEQESLEPFLARLYNILDWGKGQRLQEIQESLDFILEQDRKAKSKASKHRDIGSAAGEPPFRRIKATSDFLSSPDTQVASPQTPSTSVHQRKGAKGTYFRRRHPVVGHPEHLASLPVPYARESRRR